jgi:predicted ribosomally synthesized peptide with SipW-like signal peptide
MKKKALLIVGLALLVATAGVVYANWTDTLEIDAQVATGDIDMHWDGIYTNDDNGHDPFNGSEDEADVEPALFGQGSRDPSGPASVTDNHAPRYDKAIGSCLSGISDWENNGPMKHMWLNLSNVYPSYYCNVWAAYHNDGTVPVMAGALRATITKTVGLNTWYATAMVPTESGMNGLVFNKGAAEIEGDIVTGIACGTQIDPGEPGTATGYLHIMEAADQNATYTIHVEQDFVNWNEFDDPTMCSLSINGGTPIHLTP